MLIIPKTQNLNLETKNQTKTQVMQESNNEEKLRLTEARINVINKKKLILTKEAKEREKKVIILGHSELTAMHIVISVISLHV